MNDSAGALVEPERSAPADYRFSHHGTVAGITPIVLLNGLLNIVTLTIYRFWGKTRVRRYLWRNTTFMDEPLEYTGTGLELFIGFVIVLTVVLLPLFVISTVSQVFLGPNDPIVVILTLLFYPLLFFLIGQAIYRARRYRLSRTLWRGIRGSMTGSPHRYAFEYTAYFLLNLFTLGWSYPFAQTRLFRRIMSETAFGDVRFGCNGSSRPLYGRFALCWFGLIIGYIALVGGVVVLGSMAESEVQASGGINSEGNIDPQMLVHRLGLAVTFGFAIGLLALILGGAVLYAWYQSAVLRHFASMTRFQGLRFVFDASAWRLIRLTVGNVLIMIVTLTLGLPYTQLRVFRFFCSRLHVSGEADIEAIRQSALARPKVGEGLADAFDMGAV